MQEHHMQRQQGLDTSGRAYVVTGAGSGIDLAITKSLLAHGCRVAAWDIKPGELASIEHPGLTFTAVDVRDKAALVKAADATARAAGGIAGLVAGAGILQHTPFMELKGAMLTVQAVLPHLRKTGNCGIVLFASGLARTAGPQCADYIASKGGILGLARTLAMELAETGLRVNTISPSLVDTPMPQAVYSKETLERRGRESPMGRLVTVEDLAATALFLLSDDASFVTGQDIRVNGGTRLF
jgi:NAD(P)-dependent dehydrogenase (short-subunit alcohol dehydrogenase family)